MSVGVYDFDFMTYEHVIPNLECAKLCTYYHNMHQLAALAPQFAPERYGTFYICKEYDDGYYPKELFGENCIYRGRAFTQNNYSQLQPAIENTIPNMHLYDKYLAHYGTEYGDETQIKRILNCAHIRIAPDGQNTRSLKQLTRIVSTGRYTGIILHDYDLGSIPNVYDCLKDLSNSRKYKNDPDRPRPYSIGNKFPINVTSSAELEKWIQLEAMPNIFFLQYQGFMENQTLVNLCKDNERMAKQIYYDITPLLYDQNEFVMHWLPEIYKQVLFLRMQHIKILLTYDEKIILPPELDNFLKLLNYWLVFYRKTFGAPLCATLYSFCYNCAHWLEYRNFGFRLVRINIQDIRNSFQYFRENNYAFFKMFYDWDTVKFEGGQFINVWGRD